MATAQKPAPRLRRVLSIVAAAFVGTAMGVGVYGVGYAELPSYLGTEPETCANCHVMEPYYEAYSRGSHRSVATCDDCHLPHDSIVNRYAAKLDDGIRHSYKFTVGDIPDNIVIRDASLQIVNASCLDCHFDMTSDIRTVMNQTDDTITCTRCHSNVGHII